MFCDQICVDCLNILLCVCVCVRKQEQWNFPVSLGTCAGSWIINLQGNSPCFMVERGKSPETLSPLRDYWQWWLGKGFHCRWWSILISFLWPANKQHPYLYRQPDLKLVGKKHNIRTWFENRIWEDAGSRAIRMLTRKSNRDKKGLTFIIYMCKIVKG